MKVMTPNLENYWNQYFHQVPGFWHFVFDHYTILVCSISTAISSNNKITTGATIIKCFARDRHHRSRQRQSPIIVFEVKWHRASVAWTHKCVRFLGCYCFVSIICIFCFGPMWSCLFHYILSHRPIMKTSIVFSLLGGKEKRWDLIWRLDWSWMSLGCSWVNSLPLQREFFQRPWRISKRMLILHLIVCSSAGEKMWISH